MKSQQKFNIPYINGVWYNKNSITNIISMKDRKDKFCVTMDLKEELALLVHMKNKIVKLNQFFNGLYDMDPNCEKSFILINKYYQFMNMQEENLKFLSPIQKKRANQARELYKLMGTPTVYDLKSDY